MNQTRRRILGFVRKNRRHAVKFLIFAAVIVALFSACKGNDPPDAPATPFGPSIGDIGNYFFSSSASDPDSDSVALQFDWGDGEISNWTNFVKSGDTVTLQHSYADSGLYAIRAKAMDINEAESDWSGEHVLEISHALLWTKTYGGAMEDLGNCVQIAPDGNYIVAGYTKSFGAGGDDIYLLKIDQAGNVIWEKTFGSGGSDRAYGVVLTLDGGYVIAGCSNSFGSGDQDVYLVKTDGSGNLVWQRTYGGASDDVGYAVEAADDGGFIIAGMSLSYGYSTQFYLVRTNAAGDTVWTRTIGGTQLECAYSVTATTDGGFVAVGYTTSFGAGDGDIYLLKITAAGDTVWTSKMGTSAWDRGNSVQQTSDGGFIIGAGNGNVYLVKTDASGNVQWEKFFGNYSGGNDDYGYSAIQTLDGGYAITGKARSRVGTYDDLYIAKTDAGGSMEWEWFSNGFHIDCGNSIKQNSDGIYIAAGYFYFTSLGTYDVYLVKIRL